MDTSQLPEPARAVAEALFQEICRLRASWKLYRQLYGTSPERIAMLDRTARSFFIQCQRVFEEAILSGVSRLTDPQYSSTREKRENLCLCALVSRLDTQAHGALRKTLEARLTELKKTCASIRAHRHRAIGHSDLQVALATEQLPPVTLSEIQQAIDDVEDIFYSLAGHFAPETVYGRDVAMIRDGEHLIQALENAEQYQEQQRAERRKHQ